MVIIRQGYLELVSSGAMSIDTEKIPEDMFCLTETEENNW